MDNGTKEIVSPNSEIVYGGKTAASENHPERNEDAGFYLANGTIGVFDGVSISKSPEIASQTANDAIVQKLTDSRTKNIAQTQEEVEKAWMQAQAKMSEGFKATGVVAKLAEENGRKVVVAHSGDSRAYALTRDGQLVYLTTDHKSNYAGLSYEEIKNNQTTEGNSPIPSPGRNQITRVMSRNSPPPEIHSFDLDNHNVIGILCTTDGIHDVLTKTEMEVLIFGKGKIFDRRPLKEKVIENLKSNKLITNIREGKFQHKARNKKDDQTFSFMVW